MATIRDLVIRISVTETTDKGIRRVTTSLRETNRELDNANKNSGFFSSSLQKIGKFTWGKFLDGAKALPGLLLKIGKALLLVGTAAAGLHTLVQAGTSLAPLTGLLALLPGVAAGAAAALITLKLATSGVGDAFKQALTSKQDPKKFAASLKDLSPAARSVAVELNKLRPAFVNLRNSVQQALFAPLEGQLTATAKVLSGPVSQGASQVAREFGLAGVEVGGFLRQAQTVSTVRATFAAVAASVRQILPALQPVLQGFRDLAGVGVTFLPGLAQGAATVAQRFGAWMQQMAATGKAAEWIQNALATLKQLGTVLSNVGGIIRSVFSAASATGSSFLGVIGAALAQLNAFLKTAAGQSALQGIFVALGEIGTALGPIIGALVTALGTLAGPVGNLAQLIGPILTTAINALAPALAALEPGLAAIFSTFGQVATILAPALMPLARAISQIAVTLAPLLPLLATFIAQLVTALAPILGQLVVAVAPLIKAIIQLAGAFVPLIPPLAQIIVQLVQGLVPVLTPLIGIIAQVVGVVGGFLVSALQMLMRALGPVIPIIGQVAAQLGVALLTVLRALAPALLQVLAALLPLVPSLVQLLPPVLKIVVALAPLLAILIQLAAAILSVVLPIVVRLATFLTGVLAGAFRIVAKIISGVLGGIVKVFQWLYNVLIGHSIIPDLITGMIKWFGSLPGRIIGFFTHLAEGAAEKMTGLVKWMAGVPGKILKALGKTGSILYQAGKNIVQGLINGIWSVASSLWKTMSKIVQGVRNFWPFSPAKVGPLSGGGSPDIAGANIASMLAAGMRSGASTVMAASSRLADAASVNASAGVTPPTPAGFAAAAAPRGVASAAGAGGPVVIQVRSDGTRLGDLLVEVLQKTIRTKTGGNVQLALGNG